MAPFLRHLSNNFQFPLVRDKGDGQPNDRMRFKTIDNSDNHLNWSLMRGGRLREVVAHFGFYF